MARSKSDLSTEVPIVNPGEVTFEIKGVPAEEFQATLAEKLREAKAKLGIGADIVPTEEFNEAAGQLRDELAVRNPTLTAAAEILSRYAEQNQDIWPEYLVRVINRTVAKRTYDERQGLEVFRRVVTELINMLDIGPFDEIVSVAVRLPDGSIEIRGQQ
jgi:hypothetical protein